MSSQNDQQSENSKDKLQDTKHDRTITYQYCGKHGVRYPKGERCPSCEAEEARRD